MKRKIGVCDNEPDYAYSFMEAVNSRLTCPFEAQAFTSVESLLKFLERDQADVLLMSPEYYTEEVLSIHPNHNYSLENGRNYSLNEQMTAVYKYQKVDAVLKKILEEYSAFTGNVYPGTAGTQVIGVYSPINRVGKTTLALALGQELSKKGRVLFIDLEEFSGFSAAFAGTYELDLSDVIYLSRQEGNLLCNRLPGIVRSMREMDYIPPARIPLEIAELEDDWREFIFRIAEIGSYDVILVDFGNSIRGILEPLSKCDKIYMPVSEDPVSEGKVQQYENMLDQLDYTEIREKTVKVTLPREEHVRNQASYMDEFVWGSIAGFARNIVARDELWMAKS